MDDSLTPETLTPETLTPETLTPETLTPVPLMPSTSAAGPRIRPGSRAQLGAVNWLITYALGRATRTGPPNIFTTIGRHRSLFRRWLIFAGGLMPGGVLPRAETELLILRTAHNCGSDYEWDHHERLGRRFGLTAADIERVRSGAETSGWTQRQAAMLRATDELHADRVITDSTWAELSLFLDERELIEMCLLVGHYEMVAMTLNSLRVQLDTRRG